MVSKAALKKKKPIVVEHFVPEDEAQAEELRSATQRVTLAGFAATGEAEDSDEAKEHAAAKENLAAVQAKVKKTGVYFRFVGVGRVRWDELLREHPATAAQVAEAKKDGTEVSFDPDTFWPALMAESERDSPDITAEEWRALVFDSPDWGPGEIMAVRDKLQSANLGTRVAELGN